MSAKKVSAAAVCVQAAVLILGSIGGIACEALAQTQTPAPSASGAAVPRPIGTIKAISGNTITLTSDAGPLFDVVVEDATQLLRIEPGQKDLKGAVPLQMQDLQVGDRVLALGKVSADGRTVEATSVIAMKKADVESKQEKDRQAWQRNGTGGLVQSVDPSAGTIAISATSLAGSKTITVHIAKDTVLRRYASDSVNFDDAKPSAIEQIKPGDQLRARGMRNGDGTELAADEIVTGSFRNIAGTISSMDSAAGTIGVADLISKKPVLVKVTAQSQVRKLSPQAAQLLATRLKGTPSGAGQGASPANETNGTNAGNGARAGAAPGGAQGRLGAGSGGGRGAGGDLQQVLSRMPVASLADLQKGDAVMIVATEGTTSGAVTAITLVGGVEPILQASPSGGDAMILPPWSLDAPSGDAAQ